MPLESSGERPLKEFQHVLAKLGIFLHNYSTGECFTNQLWQDLGYSEEHMFQSQWLQLLHPEDREKATAAMESIRAGHTDRFDLIYRVKSREGDFRWIYNSGTFLSREKNGEPALYLGADRDITEFKETENRLSEALVTAEERTRELEALLTVGKSVTSVLDLNEAVKIILKQAGQIIPYDTAAVQLIEEGRLVTEGTRSRCGTSGTTRCISLTENSPQYRIISKGRPCILEKRVQDSPDQSSASPGSWMGIPLKINDSVLGLLSFNSDKAKTFTPNHMRIASGFADFMAIAVNNSRNHERMVQMATTDPLTGVGNRRWFFKNGEKLFQLARRKGWHVSILMLDLDNFKDINDRFSHDMGDVILRLTADLFSRQVRDSDLLCRYGGEEFCIFLPESELSTAEWIAKRIHNSLKNLSLSSIDRSITVSIGIKCCIPGRTCGFDQLISQADKALYRAKQEGKNCTINC